MIRKLFSGLLLSGLLLGNFTYAQQGLDNNQADFGEFMDRKGTYTRTASGKPSENYWQNKADYQIEATLDENAHVLTGQRRLHRHRLDLARNQSGPTEID